MKFTNFGKKLFAFVAIALFGLALVACNKPNNGGNNGGGENNEQEQLKAQHQANVNAVLDGIFFDDTQISEVKGNLALVQSNKKYPDVVITWTSSEADLIASDGTVSRPALDDPRAVDGKVEVTLTVSASQGEAKASKQFKVYVLGEKKVSVNTIKAAKTSFYQLMKDAGIKFNDKFSDTVQVEFTAKVELITSGSFVINDGTDSLLIYTAANGIAVGDTVKVSGELCTYYGLLEVKNASYEKVAAQNIAAPVFKETTVNGYIAELEAALDANGKIVDPEAFCLYSTSPLKLYALLIKTQFDGHESYALQDPNDPSKQVIIYYTSVTTESEAKLSGFVNKYVNIDVYTNDTKNSTYRVLYANTAITEAEAPDLTDAQKVASALGGCSVATKLTEDLTLPVVDGVVWTLKAASDYAVIENGVLKVTRPEYGKGNAKVILVATATFGAESGTKEIEVEVVEAESSAIKEVSEFATDKAYKLGFYQGKSLAYYWITGEMSGNFGATSDNPNAAADVKVVAVDGGYQLQVIVGETVKYLELEQSYNEDKAKWNTNVKIAETSTFVWQYNEEHNTFTHEFKDGNDDGVFYMGTYNSYNTLSASKISYAATSFPSHLYEVEVEDVTPIEPAEGTHYLAKYPGGGTSTNMDGTNQAAVLGLDATLFTVVGDKNGNNNNIGLNKDGTFRIYGDTGKGACKLNVSITTGEIKQIVITCQSGASGLVVLVNDVEVEGVNGVYNINAASFTITNSTGTQIQITSLDIIA